MRKLLFVVAAVCATLMGLAAPADAEVKDVTYCAAGGAIVQQQQHSVLEAAPIISARPVGCRFSGEICREGGGNSCAIGHTLSASGIGVYTLTMTLFAPAKNHFERFTCSNDTVGTSTFQPTLANGCVTRTSGLFWEDTVYYVTCDLHYPYAIDPTTVKIACGEWANSD